MALLPPPPHVVLAFAQALEELKEEGGVPARHARYDQNQRLLPRPGFGPTWTAVQGIPSSPPSGIRRAPVSPSSRCMNTSRPGALCSLSRQGDGGGNLPVVGNIGEIYPEDIAKLSAILADFLKGGGMKPQLVIFDHGTVDCGLLCACECLLALLQKFQSPLTVEEIRAPMGMLLDHIRTMLAMPANRQQWEEKQGAFDEAAVEKFTAPLKTRLSAEQPLPSMPRPNPVCWKPGRTQARGMKVGSTTGLYR